MPQNTLVDNVYSQPQNLGSLLTSVAATGDLASGGFVPSDTTPPESDIKPEQDTPQPRVERCVTDPSLDFVVIGGGPAAIMAAYHIGIEHPERKVLILEQSEHTLDEYKEKYSDIFRWSEAMNDENYMYIIPSAENNLVWLGKGLGGGTLHFGLQYIDDEELVERTYPEWRSVRGRRDVVYEVGKVTNAKRYSYDAESAQPSESYNDLYQGLVDAGLNVFNNKVYSADLSTNKRLILGDLLSGLPNVQVQYGAKVTKMAIEDGRCRGVYVEGDGEEGGGEGGGEKKREEESQDRLVEAKNFILCAGAIQSPAILQRSGVDCGNSMYDHAGFTITYGKIGVRLNTETLRIIHEVTERFVFQVQGPDVGDDQGMIFDFTEWTNSHPGGPEAIRKWKDQEYVLQYPKYNWRGHNNARWSVYRRVGAFGEPIGRFGETVVLEDFLKRFENTVAPDKISQLASKLSAPVPLGLEPSNIVPHLQTRDADLKWQSYYSTIPGQDTLLIVTHAQSTSLSGAGTVKNSDSSSDPVVELNHFQNGEEETEDQFIDDLVQAYKVNHDALTKQGYVMLNPRESVDRAYIAKNAKSIYHYHGSCAEVVDDQQRLKGVSNVVVGDASALSKPWAGSTSVPAMIMGYLAGMIACEKAEHCCAAEEAHKMPCCSDGEIDVLFGKDV